MPIFLKADLAEDDLTVDSWLPVYPGANWHEREAHEMFGIDFHGHPNLVALYLPTGFEGHPLRKDFPLLARMVKPWPGIVDVEPMPDEADDEGDEAGNRRGHDGRGLVVTAVTERQKLAYMNAQAADGRVNIEFETDEGMTLNMGPQHPATHGTLAHRGQARRRTGHRL